MARELYIDSDVLVYESAFAAQKTLYIYKDHTFDNAKEAQAYCEFNELNYRQLRREEKITTRSELLPESAASMILTQKLGRIQEACKSTSFKLVLSGDGNFRDDVAVTRKYKGNRVQEKPQHYMFIRQLIQQHKRTIITTGIEADDALCILMQDEPSGVVCSIDKDLNQIAGRHYDWNKGLKYIVTPAQGLYYFHRQLLTGDSTDNIPGLPGWGEKGAEKLLEDVRNDPVASWALVKAEYLKGPFKFKDGTVTSDNTTAYLEEQMQLLWMARSADQRITVTEYEELINE